MQFLIIKELLAVMKHLLFLQKKRVLFQIKKKKTDGKKTRQTKLALCFEKHVINDKTYQTFSVKYECKVSKFLRYFDRIAFLVDRSPFVIRGKKYQDFESYVE